MAIIRRVITTWAGIAGTPHLSTMYFTNVNGNAQGVVNAIDSFWNGLTAHIDNSLSWTVQGETELIDDATGQLVGVDPANSVTKTGTGAGTAAPPATQGLINWRTGTFVGGRGLRGKTFVPGVVTSSTTVDGRPSATYLGILNTQAAALIAATATQGPLRVFSRTHLTSGVVVSGDRSPDFAVLRSRRD